MDTRSANSKFVGYMNDFYFFTQLLTPYDSDNWRLKNDGHCTEAGNLVTAILLYRIMDEERNLTPVTEDTLREWLYTYYLTFNGRMPKISS